MGISIRIIRRKQLLGWREPILFRWITRERLSPGRWFARRAVSFVGWTAIGLFIFVYLPGGKNSRLPVEKGVEFSLWIGLGVSLVLMPFVTLTQAVRISLNEDGVGRINNKLSDRSSWSYDEIEAWGMRELSFHGRKVKALVLRLRDGPEDLIGVSGSADVREIARIFSEKNVTRLVE